MKILLDAGASPERAIYEAVKLSNVDAVRMLLECDCSVWSSLIWLSDDEEIQSLLFQHLLQRRSRLHRLALKALPKSRQDELMLFSDTILDASATRVYKELTSLYGEGSIKLRGLEPGWERTVYHCRYIKLRLAERLYSAGFRRINEVDESGQTPILRSFGNCVRWEAIPWYLEKGVCPTYQLPGPHSNALHLIRWDSFGPGRAAVLKRLNSVCNLYHLDGCECYCSSFGCSVVQSHLKPRGVNNRSRRTSWTEKQHFLKEWLIDNFIPWMMEHYHFELCRLEIFERLGMGHTCCKPHDQFLRRYIFMPDDERAEIRHEDSELKGQLETILQAYKRARINFSGSFFDFWSDWWRKLDAILPALREDKSGIWTQDSPSINEEEEYFVAILERTFGHDEDPFEDTGLADFFEFVENW